jgi:hypothetical protein
MRMYVCVCVCKEGRVRGDYAAHMYVFMYNTYIQIHTQRYIHTHTHTMMFSGAAAVDNVAISVVRAGAQGSDAQGLVTL